MSRSAPIPRIAAPGSGPEATASTSGRTASRSTELPWQLDPPGGIIVSANNAAVDDGYPYFVAAEWDPGYRAKRIIELLDLAGRERRRRLDG